MHKVGIMTWYYYKNYGSALQASALYYEIQKMGYDPLIIDYFSRKAYTDNLTYHEIIKKIKIVINDAVHKKYISQERELLFDNYYKKRIKETNKCNTYSELKKLNNEVDAFVCGSDQIWSPNNFDDKYFLSFVENNEKKIAYAPSVGLPNFMTEEIEKRVGILVKQFKHLSVREKNGADLLNKCFGIKAEVVLDPTLLLSTDEWDEFAQIKEVSFEGMPSKYMVCYFLGNEDRYVKHVNMIASMLGLCIYIIPVYQKSRFRKVPFEVGPSEFVALISYASYVCTDSFHGLAFAINYNIPFTVFERFDKEDVLNQNSRILNILEIVNLKNRLWNGVHSTIENIDFSHSNELLAKARIHSKKYLETSLKEATSIGSYKERKFAITDICCGCGACSVVCPVNAATVKKNRDGFWHFQVDKGKCIQCGKCEKVCPFNFINAVLIENVKNLYSFKSTDYNVLMRSSSGGAAFHIGKLVHERGGFVAGAVYHKEKDCVEHELIDYKCNIEKFQGSKYLQSYTADALEEIVKRSFDNQVVFVGTPCQSAALSNLLNNTGRRENVIVVDLVCHGVPSDLLWKKYQIYLQKKWGIGTHPEIIFRDKSYSWRTLALLALSENARYTKPEQKDLFYSFFESNNCNNLCCFECPYRDKSSADIRLGDYWGSRFKKDKTGVSMIIAISEKGEECIRQLDNEGAGEITRYPLSDFYKGQYIYNLPKPLYRERLFEDFRSTLTLEQLNDKYCRIYNYQKRLIHILDKIR